MAVVTCTSPGSGRDNHGSLEDLRTSLFQLGEIDPEASLCVLILNFMHMNEVFQKQGTEPVGTDFLFSLSSGTEPNFAAKDHTEAEKEVQLSEMNSFKEELLETRNQSCFSKEELSEINARADRLANEVSGESKKVNMVKMVNKALEPGMQQLQQNILNQDDQDYHVSDLHNVPMDYDWLNNLDNLKDFTGNPDLHQSKTIGLYVLDD
ncbi:hypothetical protein REPUB_Repub12eG0046500 [Reevesia pubescens]